LQRLGHPAGALVHDNDWQQVSWLAGQGR